MRVFDRTDNELIEEQMEADRQALSPVLAALQDWTRECTNRTEIFWQRQRNSIKERVATAEKAIWLGSLPLAGASAFALIIVAVLLLGSGPSAAPLHATNASADPDQQLLMAVEAAVRTESPSALAPVSVDLREISQAMPNNSEPTSHSTETRNEN